MWRSVERDKEENRKEREAIRRDRERVEKDKQEMQRDKEGIQKKRTLATTGANVPNINPETVGIDAMVGCCMPGCPHHPLDGRRPRSGGPNPATRRRSI